MESHEIALLAEILGDCLILVFALIGAVFGWMAWRRVREVSDDLYVLLTVLEKRGDIPSRDEIIAEMGKINVDRANVVELHQPLPKRRRLGGLGGRKNQNSVG